MRTRISGVTGGLLIVLLAVGVFLVFQGESRSEQSPGPNMWSITDNANRTVQIPRCPERVVILNASNLDLYYAAGGTVVGKPVTEALPPAVKEAVQNVPAVGTAPNPNVEQILALKPDLVLGANVPFHHNLIPILENAGIPMLIQSLENYQDILDTLSFYGKLTGRPEKAEQVIAKIEGQYRIVKAGHKDKTPPRALIIWGSTESFNMATPNSFSGDLLHRLGAVNIAARQDVLSKKMSYVPLSMEYVAQENPDVILLITHSSDEKVSEKFRNELAAHPAWQGLKAVRENRIHKLPYRLFAVNPGTQVGEALQLLSQLLYPEVIL